MCRQNTIVQCPTVWYNPTVPFKTRLYLRWVSCWSASKPSSHHDLGRLATQISARWVKSCASQVPRCDPGLLPTLISHRLVLLIRLGLYDYNKESATLPQKTLSSEALPVFAADPYFIGAMQPANPNTYPKTRE